MRRRTLLRASVCEAICLKDWPFSAYDFFGYLAAGFVVLIGSQLLTGAPPVLGREHGAVESVTLFLAAYITGQVVAGIAKPVLEDGVVHRILMPPSVVLLQPRRTGLLARIFRGYYKPLPERIRKRIVARANQEGASAIGEALFLHARFHKSLRNDASLTKRLDIFLAQYGFARNVSAASMTMGLVLIIAARFQHRANLPLYGSMALFVGVGMWFRYLKFFRQYSYELFNCYSGGGD